MRDPYKMFNKMIEKNPKIKELSEQAKQMTNDEIHNLPIPQWQKNILSEIRMKKLLKKSMDDFEIKEVKHWEGIILEVRKVSEDIWIKQLNKENLLETGDVIGITGENIFWGYTYLTGCLNIDELKAKSEYIIDMDKDGYLEFYQTELAARHTNLQTDENIQIGNTGNTVLDQYGVRFK